MRYKVIISTRSLSVGQTFPDLPLPPSTHVLRLFSWLPHSCSFDSGPTPDVAPIHVIGPDSTPIPSLASASSLVSVSPLRLHLQLLLFLPLFPPLPLPAPVDIPIQALVSVYVPLSLRLPVAFIHDLSSSLSLP